MAHSYDKQKESGGVRKALPLMASWNDWPAIWVRRNRSDQA